MFSRPKVGGFFIAQSREVAMVSIDHMIRAALRKDNAISRAMLRACGVAVPHRLPPVGSIVRVDAYDDVMECFANHGSPMDGR